MTGPLDGTLVVSVEHAIAAPYCTRLLADAGARVVKVERPEGDFARNYDRRARGLASHFVWCNRGKESVVLDLKAPADIAALTALVARADVFVQNLAPGAAARLGFGSAELRARHPRLVTCDISGYGATGPWAGRKAYDLLVQAEAGLLSITGTPDAPAKTGISTADIAAGIQASHAILAALLQRVRTGEGTAIDMSMLEAMTEWMGFPLYYSLDDQPPPPRAGAGHAVIYPYGPFKTRDGTILFGLQNDREWESFARVVLERTDLATDASLKSNDGRVAAKPWLDPLVTGTLGSLSTPEAIARLEKANIGTARVNEMKDVWAHPQLAARGAWTTVDTPAGTMPALRPIWTSHLGKVPALGEHTDSVLAELGLSRAK